MPIGSPSQLSPRLQNKTKKNAAKYRQQTKQQWREWESFEDAIANATASQTMAWNSFESFRLAIAGHITYDHMKVWLEALFTGEDSRYLRGIAGEDTLILAPRESAKSTFLAQFIAYELGMHTSPWIRIPFKILGISYNIETALPRSRQIQSIIQSDRYQELFPWVRPSKQKWGEKEWMIDLAWAGLPTTEEQYSYVCGGLNGGLNSRRCLVSDTMVSTQVGEIPISRLQNYPSIKVLTFNEATKYLEWGRLKATASRQASGIFEVRTSSGHKVRCTADHLFFVVGQGYKQAQDIVPGESVIIATRASKLPELQQGTKEGEQIPYLQGMLFQDSPDRVRCAVQSLQQNLYINSTTISEKSIRNRNSKFLLQSRMLLQGSDEIAFLQRLWRSNQKRKIRKPSGALQFLCDGKQAKAKEITSSQLRILWKCFCAALPSWSLLFSNLFKQVSFSKNGWEWQQPLQAWRKLQQGIFGSKRCSNEKGQSRVHGVPHQGSFCANETIRETVKPHGTPHQSRPCRQPNRKLDYSVPGMPYDSPQANFQWETDTVLSVALLGISDQVYDIEVEGNHNFFGNNVLVHNCHLAFLDDLIKSPEAIRAASVRETMESTWRSVVQFCRFDGSRAICLGTQMSPVDIYCTEFTEEKEWQVIRQSALLEREDGTEYSYWEPVDDRSPGTPLSRLQWERQNMPIEFSFQRQNKVIRVKQQSIDPDLVQRGIIPNRFNVLVLGVDLSAGLQDSNDYTAMVLGGVAHIGDRVEYWVIDTWEDRIMGNTVKLNAMIEMWNMWKHLLPTTKLYNHATGEWADVPISGLELWFDSSAYGLSLQGDYETHIIEKHQITDWHIRPVPASGRGGKLERLRKHSGLFDNKLVYFNLYGRTMSDGRRPLGRLIQQITEFGSTSHDDLADAFELCASGLRSHLPISKGNY